MNMDHSLLSYFVQDALRPYSDNFRISQRANPTQFQLNKIPYSAHVSYVHDSGDGRDNADEVRIQIGRAIIEKQRGLSTAGIRTAFLGFFEGGDTFVAWDPRHVFSLQAKHVVSVYARQSQLANTAAYQASVHSFHAKFLNETSFAIALPANALGAYLENIDSFHRMPSEDAIRSFMHTHSFAYTESGYGDTSEFEFGTDDHREKFTYQRTAYPRDPKFSNMILKAYNKTCCVCNKQLGIVQAAHIIPHSEPNSPNEVTNGLALCIAHHRLYDDALLLPGPKQRLIFNVKKADYLEQTGQGKGLDEIEQLSKNGYNIPDSPDLRPDEKYLAQGLSIRLAEGN